MTFKLCLHVRSVDCQSKELHDAGEEREREEQEERVGKKDEKK